MRLSLVVSVLVVALWIPGRVEAVPGCAMSSDCSTSLPVCNALSICELCSAANGGEAVCQASHGGTHCDTVSGACVQCNASSDCPDSAPLCTNHVCGPCAADAVCAASHGGKHCELAAVAQQGQCVACRSSNNSADCAAAAPVCVNDLCTACVPTDPAPSAQCSRFAATTVCSAGGACVQCTTDVSCPSAAAPHCVANTCGPCDATTGTHGDESCAHFADGGVPACQPNDGVATGAGSCKQCSVNNTSACGGGTPACNFATGGCQLCTVTLGDLGGVSTGCAANPNGHACQGSGASVFCGCATDADCGGPTSGRVCDTILSQCAAGCSRAPSRNHCPASQFCTTNDLTGAQTGVCTTTCNYDVDCGADMPFCLAPDGDAGVGRCAACRTDADCTSGPSVCDPASKVCVQCTAQSAGACSASGAGAACLADNRCGCNTDADCGGRVCSALAMHTCVDAVDMSVPLDAGEPDLAVPPYTFTDDGCGCSVGRSTPTPIGGLLVLALGALLCVWTRRSRNPRT